MIKNKLARKIFGSTFVATMVVPAIALAQESEKVVYADNVYIAKAIAAGAAMSISALSAGYAQARIGAAGAGTLAERPEAGMNLIILQALPEIIVLLGFVIAFMIGTA